MGLEQAPPKGERVDAPEDIAKLQDSPPAAKLAGALDFTPRPTRVADMGLTAASVEAADTPQYIDFGGDIYGQKKQLTQGKAAKPSADIAITGGYSTQQKTQRE